MKRHYTAPLNDRRCKADRKPLADGTGACCMLPALKDDPDGYCHIHAKRQRTSDLAFYRSATDQERAFMRSGCSREDIEYIRTKHALTEGVR
jgi:hypothetical protein